MPKCPYCGGPLQPTAYCPTCRMTVPPDPSSMRQARYVQRQRWRDWQQHAKRLSQREGREP